MDIPEMQEMKKKYPVYKDIPDEQLLDAVVKKYPVYQPIAQRAAEARQKEEIDTSTYVGGVEGTVRDLRTYAIQGAEAAVKGAKKALMVGPEAMHRVAAHGVGFLTQEQPPDDIAKQVEWMKQEIPSEFAPTLPGEERQVVALKRALSLGLLAKTGYEGVRAILNDPTVKNKISTFIPELKYRVGKGLGIPQETSLKVLTDAEIRAAYQRGDITLGQAVEQNRAMYNEEFAKRQKGETIAPVNPFTGTPQPKAPVTHDLPQQTNVQVGEPSVSVSETGASTVNVTPEEFKHLEGLRTLLWQLDKQGRIKLNPQTQNELDLLGRFVLKVMGFPDNYPLNIELEYWDKNWTGGRACNLFGSEYGEGSSHIASKSRTYPNTIFRGGKFNIIIFKPKPGTPIANHRSWGGNVREQSQFAVADTLFHEGLHYKNPGSAKVSGPVGARSHTERMGKEQKEYARTLARILKAHRKLEKMTKGETVGGEGIGEFEYTAGKPVEVGKPAGNLDEFVSNRIKLKNGWARKQKLPLDDRKWDDQSAQNFEKYAKLFELSFEDLPDVVEKTDMSKFNNALIDIQGEGEVASVEFAKFAKKLGSPFFLGQKYPQFKPVYTAVQNGVDLNAELFFEAMDILKPMDLRSVSKTSQDKLLSALKTGNDPAIKRDFTQQELVERFHLDPKEIDIYNRFRRLYKLGLNMELQKRKILMDYIAMTPKEQADLDAKFAETVKRLGGGYMSMVRSEGVWGVYQPPLKPGEKPRFFTRVGKKSEAIRIADQLGEGATYGMMDTTSREAYRHLTLTDLENLIAAAKVSPDAQAINQLREELKKRTFLAHWIRRRDVPGYEWTWDNIVDSAIDYAAGASNSLSRVSGRTSAETAYQMAQKTMDPSLRLYTRNYIDGFYNTGTLGFGAMNKTLYAWKLAFKVSWLLQNLSQPLSTTYPVLAHYYGGVAPERVLLSSYKLAAQFLSHKWKGTPAGISPELYRILQRAEKQGVLGDQMTKFQLGAKQLSKQEFERWVGLFGRAGEAVNRSHAAICGYRVATDILKLEGEENIYAFVKEFIGKTQFLYGKQNIPTLITGAGNMKNLIRTCYTFRHYNLSYLQLLNSMMPWRGGTPREYGRALGSLGVQTGIYGLPLAVTIAGLYKLYKEHAKNGGTAEADFRMAMRGVLPTPVIDAILRGAYTIAGIDASALIGLSDAIPTYSSDLEKIGGAPIGFAKQLIKAATYAVQGDYLKALEYGSPDAIRNVLRAWRYAREGLRKDTGELVIKPSALDVAVQSVGFTTNAISKAYAAKEAISSIQQTHVRSQTEFNRRLAQARMNRDWEGYRKILLEMREHNKTAGKGDRVHPSQQSQNVWRRKFQGRQLNVPRAQRRTARELQELYGVRERK